MGWCLNHARARGARWSGDVLALSIPVGTSLAPPPWAAYSGGGSSSSSSNSSSSTSTIRVSRLDIPDSPLSHCSLHKTISGQGGQKEGPAPGRPGPKNLSSPTFPRPPGRDGSKHPVPPRAVEQCEFPMASSAPPSAPPGAGGGQPHGWRLARWKWWRNAIFAGMVSPCHFS